MDNLTKQWKSLIDLNLERVYSLPLSEFKSLEDTLIFYIRNIFNILIKLKNKTFYKKKEIETIFLLTKRDINDLNNYLQLIIDEDDMTVVPLLIYFIIGDIFNDLISLMEDVEFYEGAKNLLEFKQFWFAMMNIKLPKPNVK